MFEIFIYMLIAVRWLLIELPPRVLAITVSWWLMLILWLHHRRSAVSQVTGAGAALAILGRHNMDTRVLPAKRFLVDLFDPKKNLIALSERTFHGTSIAALSVAAHEVGHALQSKRFFVPWVLRQCSLPFAQIGLALCFWLWFLGAVMENQRILIAAAGCFGLYTLFLLLQLICEFDASRRAVRELVHCGVLQPKETRIARRVLRSAAATYVASFMGSALALTFFLSFLDWAPVTSRFTSVVEQLSALMASH